MSACLNILGLLANLFGVVLLFVFGMPFRVSVSEGELITTNSLPEKERVMNSIYRILGYVGLALIVLGTGLQIVANLNA